MKTTFVYTGIRVKDLERSVQFYTQVLGMKETGRSKIGVTEGEVVSLVSEEGGPELELNFYSQKSKFTTDYVVGEGLDHLAFKVDDLEKAQDEAKKLGYPTVLEIKGQTSKWVYIQDPNGIYIELLT